MKVFVVPLWPVLRRPDRKMSFRRKAGLPTAWCPLRISAPSRLCTEVRPETGQQATERPQELRLPRVCGQATDSVRNARFSGFESQEPTRMAAARCNFFTARHFSFPASDSSEKRSLTESLSNFQTGLKRELKLLTHFSELGYTSASPERHPVGTASHLSDFPSQGGLKGFLFRTSRFGGPHGTIRNGNPAHRVPHRRMRRHPTGPLSDKRHKGFRMTLVRRAHLHPLPFRKPSYSQPPKTRQEGLPCFSRCAVH